MDKIEALKKYWGYPSFRGDQEEAIDSLTEDLDVIYIAKTGDGKSICFQVPSIIKKGTSIVVSPLKALMEDQVKNLESKGVKATFLNSDLEPEESKKRYINLMNGEYDLLYVAPERLASSSFIESLAKVRGWINYFIIDEFDCVDDYGSSGFRPEYLKVWEVRRSLENKLDKRIPVGVFTATASTKVREMIEEMFWMNEPDVYIGDLIGSHIKIDINEFKDKDSKDRNLFGYIKTISKKLKKEGGSGIIFCSTRKNVDNLEKQLKAHKLNVCKYHAGMAVSRKSSSAKKFMNNKVDFIICTNAFWRGVDKPDIRYVLHYGIPNNISAYLQEIGRAWRDWNIAHAITLFSGADVNSRNFMARTSSQKEELQNLLQLFDKDTCYIEALNEYFDRESTDNCNQCSQCDPSLIIEVDEDNTFKVKKIPRKTTRKKTTTRKRIIKKKPTKKRATTKKATAKKKPIKKTITRKTTIKKKPIKKTAPKKKSVQKKK